MKKNSVITMAIYQNTKFYVLPHLAALETPALRMCSDRVSLLSSKMQTAAAAAEAEDEDDDDDGSDDAGTDAEDTDTDVKSIDNTGTSSDTNDARDGAQQWILVSLHIFNFFLYYF